MNNDTPRQVQLRKDLQQSRQQHQGKSYLVVKDPIARRYFRFTETQSAILDSLAEPADAETVAAQVSEKLGGKVSSSTIAAFFDSLESKDLLDTPAVRERIGSGGNPNKRSSILYKQVASFNPERLFDWLQPRTRWAFTPAFQVLGTFLIISGISLFFLHWGELRAATPNLLNVWTILMVWPIVFSVSAYHEFSHGLTCRHFGGQVKEVGFMLIYFSPAFYCDVSDAWMFPKRYQRMLVTFAGGYSQLMLWGLCTILWRITEPDTYINQIMVVVVIFSGLQTLFNFNPLIKLDGYYMLSDYLEVPNLRAKAFSSLWNWITKNPRRKSFREERSQLIYGVCAVIFSSTLLILVYTRLFTWATDNWSTAGLVAFAVFSTVTLRRTATESMSGLRTLISHAWAKRIRNGLIVVTALLISILVPWELKIKTNLMIRDQSEVTVRAETAGRLTDIRVRNGSHVQKDELLARTTDYVKENEIKKITADLEVQRRTLERLEAKPRPVEILQKQTRVAAVKEALDNVRRNQENRRKLEANVAELKKTLEGLIVNADTTKQLYSEKLVAEIVYKNAQNAVDVQREKVLAAELAIKAFDENADNQTSQLTKELATSEADLEALKAGNPPEVIRVAQADIAKSEKMLASLNAEIAKSEIRSPIDGTVATPLPEQMMGKQLAAGEEFIRLVNNSGLVAELLVPEKEIDDVKLGNIVWMKMGALRDQDFEGRVSYIAPVAHTVENQQMVIVHSQLPNDEKLKPGMTGVGRIYAGKLPIIRIATRRMERWLKTEFIPRLMP
jgi:multidrug efflux pump subunit AcrA (membrane-fusion protein)